MTKSDTQRRTRDPEKTRELILEAAVNQFGAYGFSGASMRDIANDAGVNLASANYHFGSKLKVYLAVIERYFARVNNIRIEAMERAAKLPPGEARVRAIVRAYTAPHIELVVGQKEHAYGRLIIHVMNDDEVVANHMFEREVNSVRIPFLGYLQESFPEVDKDAISRGIGFAVMIMASAPFDPSYRSLMQKSALDASVEDLIQSVENFVYGGLIHLFGKAPE